MAISLLPSNPLLKFLLLGLIASCLPACTGILESNRPAREVYLLHPPGGPAVTPPEDAPKLVLSLVTVPGLDTSSIQVLNPNARLIPVANAHWADNLPEVMSSLSRRSLMDSGLFSDVSLGDIARPGNWSLQLELQAFYGVQDNTGETQSVLVKLGGSMRCGESSEVLRLQSSNRVATANMTDLVAAHQQSLSDILQELPLKIRQACLGD